MTNPFILPSDMQSLLLPRKALPWTKSAGLKPPWAKPVLIDNEVSRSFFTSMINQEREERFLIQDQVEGALQVLPSPLIRFWMFEFKFIERILALEQLVFYAPAFVKLALIMPKDLILFRRKVVSRYLEKIIPQPSEFVTRQQTKFVRSCVLFYPSDLLFVMADRFQKLMVNSSDQSKKANRQRVVMSVRALQMMSDAEICHRFNGEKEYVRELKILRSQCQFYHISAAEIYRVSSQELRQFFTG